MDDISGSAQLLPAGVELTMKYLLNRLKWLETIECRAAMDESVRVAERKIITDKFKNMLAAKELFTERWRTSVNESKN